MSNSQPRKKRGRKPKGGCVGPPKETPQLQKPFLPAVVVRLMCNRNDVESADCCDRDSSIVPRSSYIESSHNSCSTVNSSHQNKEVKSNIIEKASSQIDNDLDCNDGVQSACFWCTCTFDSTPIHIPKHRTVDDIKVYGNFCSPQCAAGFLFAERKLDESERYERFHLLSAMYAKNNKPIRPAPSPHYLLKKFMGNLSIEEYRSIHDFDQNLLVVEKPLSILRPDIGSEINSLDEGSGLPRPALSLYRSARPATKSNSLYSNFNMKSN